MISQDALPEALVPRCLDVLRVLSPNERDLIRLVVEVVHELRDRDSGDDDAGVRSSSLPTQPPYAHFPKHFRWQR
jgi:hypothetical protein